MQQTPRWKLKDEALDRAGWRTGFGGACGPVVGRTAEYIVLY
jgi:hypothetical protein